MRLFNALRQIANDDELALCYLLNKDLSDEQLQDELREFVHDHLNDETWEELKEFRGDIIRAESTLIKICEYCLEKGYKGKFLLDSLDIGIDIECYEHLIDWDEECYTKVIECHSFSLNFVLKNDKRETFFRENIDLMENNGNINQDVCRYFQDEFRDPLTMGIFAKYVKQRYLKDLIISTFKTTKSSYECRKLIRIFEDNISKRDYCLEFLNILSKKDIDDHRWDNSSELYKTFLMRIHDKMMKGGFPGPLIFPLFPAVRNDFPKTCIPVPFILSDVLKKPEKFKSKVYRNDVFEEITVACYNKGSKITIDKLYETETTQDHSRMIDRLLTLPLRNLDEASFEQVIEYIQLNMDVTQAKRFLEIFGPIDDECWRLDDNENAIAIINTFNLDKDNYIDEIIVCSMTKEIALEKFLWFLHALIVPNDESLCNTVFAIVQQELMYNA